VPPAQPALDGPRAPPRERTPCSGRSAASPIPATGRKLTEKTRRHVRCRPLVVRTYGSGGAPPVNRGPRPGGYTCMRMISSYAETILLRTVIIV